MNRKYSSGFTLLEMSIVILVVGFLIIGTIQGYELVKTARLVSDIKKLQEYKLAVQTFQSKYEKLPGDFNKATTFLGAAVKNGNGDGKVQSWQGIAWGDEYLWTWTHLSYAKVLKSGNKGGQFENAGLDFLELGVNIPRLGKDGMGINFIGAEPSVLLTTSHWNNPLGKNWFQLGGSSTVTGAYKDFFWGSGYNSFEASWVDDKIDDGNPGTGLLISRWGSPSKANPYGYNTQLCTTTGGGGGTYLKGDEKTGCTVGWQID